LYAETFFFDASIVIIADMNWSAIASGTGPGGQPSSSDAIFVQNGKTLTVDVNNGVCLSLQLGLMEEQTMEMELCFSTQHQGKLP
jgi:hypothetical protein